VSTFDGGQRVGRYRILRFLGAGAMGEVYLAEDPHIERRLAIKTVRLTGGRPQDIEDRTRRLLREARAAGRLLHPNVVTLFDAGEEEGLLYLAFEFVEGCDLASRLGSGEPPTLREVLRITRQVAEALDYAHRHGIVHRDIKPSNILIDAAGHVKVADFGIAKVAGQNTELTMVGSVMGSPQYLSPEQVRGDDLDGRSDVFSLGVVLYELLSGRRPFDGETITTLVYQILHKDPSIAELRSVPLRLEQLLHRMLAKDRDDRLATAGLVAEELAAIERELPEETLAAPAAPAAAVLDVTRVMPSRSQPAGAGAAGSGGSGGAGATTIDGIAVAGWAAGSPGAPLAPGGLGAPGGPGSPGLQAAQGSPGVQAAAAAGGLPHPGTAPVPASAPPPAPVPHAPAAPARRSSGARLWLALAVLLLVFCGVVGVGAYWVWQRFVHHAGQEMSRLLPSAPSSAPPAAPPPTTGTTGPAAGAGAAPAPPPPAGSTAPANAGQAAGVVPASGPQPQSSPAATRQTQAAPPAATSTPRNRTPASVAGSAPATAGTPTGARPSISISKPPPPPRAAPAEEGAPATTAGGAGGAGTAGTAASAGSPSRSSSTLGDAGAGQQGAPDREGAAAGGVTAPTADRVIHSGLELAFRVNPPDAFVLLDGAVIGRAQDWSGQRGGRSFTLPSTGSHVVKIKKPGMKDYRITVEAGDARGTTPVVVNLQPLPAAQVETADLQAIRVREAIALRISPEVNAVVLVDGVAAGPVKNFAGRFGHAEEWLSLPVGMHRVTLVAPGYARRDLAVEISPGADKARQKIDIPLSPATGNP
jgi:tRNA A-37 threonylcarbamoyl transferase component Bud32